jgi:DNA-binding PadR family transcriptional regulator
VRAITYAAGSRPFGYRPSLSAPTKYAVLGLVARRPTYGYALMQQLRRWSIDPTSVRSSSVYTALSRLEDEQLIEVRGPSASTGTDRQPRLTYGATDAGQQRLDEWLSTAPASYDELRLRIALARPSDLPALIGFVVAAEEECLQRLQAIEAPAIAELTSRLAPWEALCGAILGTLDTGELAGRVKWLQDARVALESMLDHPARQAD